MAVLLSAMRTKRSVRRLLWTGLGMAILAFVVLGAPGQEWARALAGVGVVALGVVQVLGLLAKTSQEAPELQAQAIADPLGLILVRLDNIGDGGIRLSDPQVLVTEDGEELVMESKPYGFSARRLEPHDHMTFCLKVAPSEVRGVADGGRPLTVVLQATLSRRRRQRSVPVTWVDNPIDEGMCLSD